MGGITGEYEQLVKINGKWYKYILYHLTPDRLEYIQALRLGNETEIPNWLVRV